MGLSAFNRARERQARERAEVEQEKQKQMKQENAGKTEDVNSEIPGVSNAEEKSKRTRRKV
jgi:hypothetical protein